MKTTPYLLLALLVGAGAVMLYRAPVQRYVVTCERTTQVTCDLERATAANTQRWHVPLGLNPSAVVRIVPRRRGAARVFLYLQSAAAGDVFAAEFEGDRAAIAGAAAAAQLNRVLQASAPAVVRITAAPPPIFRWFAWGMLGVMALLVLLGYRNAQSRAPRPGFAAAPGSQATH